MRICQPSFGLACLLFGAFLAVGAPGASGDPQTQEVLTNESILKMRAADLSEATMIAAIEGQPGEYSLGVEAMIALHKAGVSDNVIQAMLRRSARPTVQPSAALVIPDGTVVKLRLKKTLSSGNALPGNPVPVVVSEDVVVAGVVVVVRDTVVPTVVKSVNSARRFHGKGTLELEFQRLVLVDGTTALLREGAEITRPSRKGPPRRLSAPLRRYRSAPSPMAKRLNCLQACWLPLE